MKPWLIVIVIVVLAAAGWYYWQSRPQEVVEAPPPPVVEMVEEPAPEPVEEAVQPQPEPPPLPEPEAEPADPLPALAQSDPVAVETLDGLFGESMTQQHFAGDFLVSRMVATVDALSSAQVPGQIQAVSGPDGEFEVTADDRPGTPILNEAGDPVPQFLVDPVNYRRYLVYVEMLEALDPAEVAELYQRYYPLMQEAWRDQGYTDIAFHDRLMAVLDELLATPDVEGPLRVMKPEGVYLFVDPELEALSAGQKILLRMGPDNARRVKAKLREIRAALRPGP